MATLNLEREALASYNYLEQLVDPATGFTFFDVFLTDPAEAAHDWPDFLDVPGRSAETSVLLRHMTGRPVQTEEAFFRRIFDLAAQAIEFAITDGFAAAMNRFNSQFIE